MRGSSLLTLALLADPASAIICSTNNFIGKGASIVADGWTNDATCQDYPESAVTQVFGGGCGILVCDGRQFGGNAAVVELLKHWCPVKCGDCSNYCNDKPMMLAANAGAFSTPSTCAGMSTFGTPTVRAGCQALYQVACPSMSGLCTGRSSTGTPGASGKGDPHLHLAHGGRADVRGEHGEVFNMLSAKNVSLNVGIEEADFRWAQRLVHGTKMNAAYWTIRTGATGALYTIEYNLTSATSGKAFAVVRGGEAGAEHKVKAGKPFAADGLSVAVTTSAATAERVATVTTPKWRMRATAQPVPFGKANEKTGEKKALINVHVEPLYDADHDVVAPHGLFGQSFDGDEYDFDGKLDPRNDSTVTTSAQGEGAIEGVIGDYKVASKFATDFKFSRFALEAAKPRDTSKLTGVKRARNRDTKGVGASDHDMMPTDENARPELTMAATGTFSMTK